MAGDSRTLRWVLPVLVVLLAAFFRLWQLGDVPPGFQFDEAHNAIDAARVLDGERLMFFPDNGGREPLVTYLHAAVLDALGRDRPALALRLVSALVGIATVAVVYAFAARFFRDRVTGLLAASFLAVSYWHVHFSRFGIRAILAPLWTTLALWAWWRAVENGSVPNYSQERPTRWQRLRASRATAALLCGVFLAAAVYSHPSGRLIPLILLGHVLFRTLRDRRQSAAAWQSLIVAGLTAFVLFIPLGWNFYHNPLHFTGHPSDVSLQAVADAEYGGSLARAFGGNVSAVAGMFFVAGDPSTFHNLPDLPVFDPLSALAAVVGLGVLLGMLAGRDGSRRDRAVLVGLWLVIGLLPTLLSDRPPNYSRAIAALPAIVMLPALGLRWALDAVTAMSDRVRAAVMVGVIAVAGVWTAWHYFGTFASAPGVYYSYDVDKVDAYEALADLADEASVFLHPLWAEQATIAYLNADGPVRVLDGRDTLVLPADGRDVIVAFPAKELEREDWDKRVASLLGESATRDDIADAQGGPMLVTYRVPPSAYGDLEPPRDAPLEPAVFSSGTFGEAIRLSVHTLGEARPGEPLPVTLVWHGIAPLPANLTTFVQLVGPDGESLGQEDREPGRTSYRTSQWRPGDVVIDRFTPVLAEDAEGPVTVRVGWYNLETGERLSTGEGDAVLLGPVEVTP